MALERFASSDDKYVATTINDVTTNHLIVVSTYGPSHIWVADSRQFSYLSILMNNMQHFYNDHNNRISIPPHQRISGQPCAILRYQSYFRGLIIEENFQIVVKCVDMGLSFSSDEYDDLFYLSRRFLEPVILCLEIRLDKVTPRANANWDFSVINFLRTSLSEQTITFHENRKVEGVSVGDIFINATGENIAQTLIQSNYARSAEKEERILEIAWDNLNENSDYDSMDSNIDE